MALFVCLLPLGASAQRSIPIPMPTVNPDSLIKHVTELSSEAYEGRLAGTRGYDRAARYCEQVLRSYGVQGYAARPEKNRSWREEFELESNEIENCKFNIYIPGSKDRRSFTLGNEFCCAGMTGRGYVDAEMVFCGYGIDVNQYNEYDHVDVQGKIVVLLTGLPVSSNVPQSVQEQYATLRDKARTAERHGALGVLAVNISPSCLPYEPQGRVYCGEMPHMKTFPILHLTMVCGREIFAAEGANLDSAVARIERLHKPQSFEMRRHAEIDVNAIYRGDAVTSNVVGILPGRDKRMADEIIVVGASLDGVGMQGETCLFPGADINASGVAAVLETARVLSMPGFHPKRSIVFVLFSGSEQQYLGSREFIAQFPRLRRVEAFINAQNLGYGDSVVVLGDNKYPVLAQIAYGRDSLSGLHSILRTEEKTNVRGDARAFDAMDIPSLVFTTHNGMHHNRVSSDVWENIDRRILTISSQLIAETVMELGEGIYQGRSPQSKIHK